MTLLLLVVLGLFLTLDVLALAELTPDTHAQTTQFGDYRF